MSLEQISDDQPRSARSVQQKIGLYVWVVLASFLVNWP